MKMTMTLTMMINHADTDDDDNGDYDDGDHHDYLKAYVTANNFSTNWGDYESTLKVFHEECKRTE